MLPSAKRRFIDLLRAINNILKFSNLKPIKRLISLLKKLNKGLIESEVGLVTKPSFFPNEFELELYQTDSQPKENLEELINFKFSTSFHEGVKKTADWFMLKKT